MKIRLNPVLLGAFVIGAAVLLVVALAVFGAANPFRTTGHFVFYLNGSAAGISEGTAVRFQGVRVGQIDQINVLYDRDQQRSYVAVVCEVNRNAVTDLQGQPLRIMQKQVLLDLVTNGLRAEIKTSGLVGAKFVGLDFFNPPNQPAESYYPPSQYPVVPTAKGTMAQITDDVELVAAELSKIDFQGIGKQLHGLLTSAHQQVSEMETNQLATHISSAAASIDQLVASSAMHGTVSNLQTVSANLHQLVTNVNAQIRPLSTQLNATLSQGQAALNSVGQTAHDVRDFSTSAVSWANGRAISWNN